MPFNMLSSRASTALETSAYQCEAPVDRMHSVKPVQHASTKCAKESASGFVMTARQFSCPDHKAHSQLEITTRLQGIFVLGTEELVPSEDPDMHVFDGRIPPLIDVDEYLARVVENLSKIVELERKKGNKVHSDLPVRYILAGLILIERVQQSRGLVLTPLNIHRLIVTSILLASKVLDDKQPSINFFAVMGGVSAENLSKMERAFLALLNFDVNIDRGQFTNKYEKLLGVEIDTLE